MFGFGDKKQKQKAQRKASRKRKLLLFLAALPVLYVLSTGPALWSRAQISNDRYRKGVVYYVAPLMWLNYQFRDKSLVEKVGIVDLTASNDTSWYRYLENYWGVFGSSALAEANKITLMLKFKLNESPVLGN